MTNNLTIFILAGGKGERLRPITKSIPKPLIKINKKEILSYVIDHLNKFEFKDLYILTGYKHKLIDNFIKKKYKNNLKVKTIFTGVNSDISERIKKALKYASENILICYGDTLANVNLKKLKILQKKIKNKVIISTFQYKSSFGIIKQKKNNEILNYLEKPKLNLFINIGYMLFKKEKLKKLNNHNSFESFLKKIIEKEKVFSNIHKGKHITVNTVYELEQAKKDLK